MAAKPQLADDEGYLILILAVFIVALPGPQREKTYGYVLSQHPAGYWEYLGMADGIGFNRSKIG